MFSLAHYNNSAYNIYIVVVIISHLEMTSTQERAGGEAQVEPWVQTPVSPPFPHPAKKRKLT
jgi:hypothetical protein